MTTAIDLFAGGGGFTEGAEQAGVRVLWAANHNPAAVDCHRQNHPTVVHACQDLHQADFRDAPKHDVLLASPSCVGHTHARGKDRPSHDADRATAWAVVTAAEVHRPAVVLVENVPEFQSWELFPAWLLALRSLGYAVAPYVRDAAHHGVPQNRERLFFVATRSRSPLFLTIPERPIVPFSSFIRWNEGKWSKVDKPRRALETLTRIAHARPIYGERFLDSYYGSAAGGRSIDRPIGTITTKDRWAVIRGDEMRMLLVGEARDAMGFRSDYILPANNKIAMKLLGNAVCPQVATDMLSAVLAAA